MYSKSDWILQLPVNLIFDILVVLPMKTIFRCKCVCTTFLRIISDPYFAELHLKRESDSDYSVIIQDCMSPYSFSFVPLVDFERSSDCLSHHAQNLNIPARVVKDIDGLAMVIGSCNGLICLQYGVKGVALFYVCNPILGEYMPLPDPKFDRYERAGFGYCFKTKQYKVIRFITGLFWEILTLGTRYWKKIENAPPSYGVLPCDFSYNGNLHWITEEKKSICALNLSTEIISLITPPSQFDSDFVERIDRIQVGELHGLFSLCYRLDRARIEVYVMREYSVKKTWVKESSIDFSLIFEPRLTRFFWTIRFLKNGNLVLSHFKRSLIYYNLQEGTTKDISTTGIFDAIGFLPSFISLSRIAGKEDIEVVGWNKR